MEKAPLIGQLVLYSILADKDDNNNPIFEDRPALVVRIDKRDPDRVWLRVFTVPRDLFDPGYLNAVDSPLPYLESYRGDGQGAWRPMP